MADDDLLTRSRWNELFRLVAESHLPEARFRRESMDCTWAGFGYELPAIVFGDGGEMFAIAPSANYLTGTQQGRYSVRMRPGAERQCETHTNLTWDDLKRQFARWLWSLRNEIESPDLWARLSADRRAVASLAAPSEGPNAPFTEAEQRVLRAAMDELRDYVTATYLNLTADQTAAINAGLDEIKEAAGRLGRFDWRMLVLGTIASWVLATALPPDVVRDLFTQLAVVVQGALAAAPHLIP